MRRHIGCLTWVGHSIVVHGPSAWNTEANQILCSCICMFYFQHSDLTYFPKTEEKD